MADEIPFYLRAPDVIEPPASEVAAETGFWKTVDDFKAKALEFAELFTVLDNKSALAATDPQTKRDYDALMDDGDWLRGKVQAVADSIDWASNMIERVGSVFEMNGLPAPSQLGIAPLVLFGVVATITGGITLMTNWLLEARSMDQRLEVLRMVPELEAQGIPRTDAIALAKKALERAPSMLDNIGTILMWAAIGGVAWFLYAQFARTSR